MAGECSKSLVETLIVTMVIETSHFWSKFHLKSKEIKKERRNQKSKREKDKK